MLLLVHGYKIPNQCVPHNLKPINMFLTHLCFTSQIVFILSGKNIHCSKGKKKNKFFRGLECSKRQSQHDCPSPTLNSTEIPDKRHPPRINVYKFRGSRQTIAQKYLQDITSFLHSERYLVSIFENKWHSLVNLVSKQLASPAFSKNKTRKKK